MCDSNSPVQCSTCCHQRSPVDRVNRRTARSMRAVRLQHSCSRVAFVKRPAHNPFRCGSSGRNCTSGLSTAARPPQLRSRPSTRYITRAVALPAGDILLSFYSMFAGLDPLLTAVAAAGAASVGLLYLLLKADCNLRLWWRSKPPANAFKNKVVWITGASRGIGEMLALYLAGQGAHLILSARSQDQLEAVKKACLAAAAAAGSSIQVQVLALDLMGPFQQLEAAAAAADGAFGGRGVDYLLHNAGASQHALSWQTNAAVTKELMDLNALGPILLTRAALPHLIRRGKGRLVVVASMAALVPSPGQAVYSAAKMALRGYFSSVATEVADTSVTVTICYPGPTATGSPTQERTVYGAEGKVSRPGGEAKGKLAPARVVELIAAAAAAGTQEAWMAKQPVLLLAYLMQYVPWLAMWVLKKVGPARARAIAKGESGYDVTQLVAASAAKQQ